MRKIIMTLIMLCMVSLLNAQNMMEVNTRKLGAPIQSTMYGIFFEDINYAADGGLYGELVKNRSFEFPQSFMGWQVFGCVELKDDGPFCRCPHYVILSSPDHSDRRTGLTNEGFFGIGVKKGASYRFSVWAKAPKGKGAIRVQLINEQSMDEKQEFIEEGDDDAWSEEDRDYFDAIIAKLEVTQDDALLTDNQIEFLKSLKERYTWKPTGEQMHYLYWIANVKLGDSVVEQEVSKRLNNLYNDLKKLKEG